MIALSVPKLKNVFARQRNLSLKTIKPKKKKKTLNPNFFVESLDQCQRLEVRKKARNVFRDEPRSVGPQCVTQHRIFIKFFRFCPNFLAFFSLVFRTSNFWSLRNLVKQLFHSRVLEIGRAHV